ncbi:MAG TPA: 4'-phosphopantetheinyl transferase superfamily protein [Gammaproteobacteria bacterium]|nr:4'-phosphopantetheinyl transferase superfamily protein [Gammaproteobacteria bacterium]
MNASSCSHTALEQTLLSRLHKTEQARYGSFTNLQRRQTWLAGRVLLLAALERQLGQIDAASIRTDEQGGVRFQGNAIHLSMSHSRDMLVVSLSGMRTGVDVEWPQPRSVLQHAERVFNRTEADQMHALTEAERRDVFYVFWTLKEAACKAAGVSLWESLHCACFDLRNGRFNSHPPFPSGDWHFMSACIEPGWRVAVATRGAVNTPQIECWRLTAAEQWHRQPLVRQLFLFGS